MYEKNIQVKNRIIKENFVVGLYMRSLRRKLRCFMEGDMKKKNWGKEKDNFKCQYPKSCHTDLAVEMKEDMEQQSELEGVQVLTKKHKYHGIVQTQIEIVDACGERLLGKPVGHYITLETKALTKDTVQHKLSEILCEQISRLAGDVSHILVAGLGNRKVTPDAIGPKVMDELLVTRHLFIEQIQEGNSEKESAKVPDLQSCEKENKKPKKQMKMVSAIAPGVMGQTGMETVEIIKAVVQQTKPDLVIVIDALAARSSGRLNRTIQICDTGIHPGAGVGNNRQEISEESVGVKVIAIGVPTVIAVPTIISDAMEAMLFHLHKETEGKLFRECNYEEQYALASELVRPYFSDMFVTPKNIDEEVERISSCIALGINQYITGDLA